MGIAPEDAMPPTTFGPGINELWNADTPEGFSSPIALEKSLIYKNGLKTLCFYKQC